MGRTKAKSTRLALESGRKATSTPLDPHVIQWAATEQTNLLHARRALSTKHGKGEEDWEPVEPGFDEVRTHSARMLASVSRSPGPVQTLSMP